MSRSLMAHGHTCAKTGPARTVALLCFTLLYFDFGWWIHQQAVTSIASRAATGATDPSEWADGALALRICVTTCLLTEGVRKESCLKILLTNVNFILVLFASVVHRVKTTWENDSLVVGGAELFSRSSLRMSYPGPIHLRPHSTRRQLIEPTHPILRPMSCSDGL